MAVTLLLGGARSGKSMRAEALAKILAAPVSYVATAPHIKGDEAWAARIVQHQSRRPAHWALIEEPLDLLRVLRVHADTQVLLIDCLTLWLSNLMFAEKNIGDEVECLCQALLKHQGEIILVSNEVGMGLVPETELGRTFRDEQGRLNQAVAKVAHRVEFIAAGLPIRLK